MLHGRFRNEHADVQSFTCVYSIDLFLSVIKAAHRDEFFLSCLERGDPHDALRSISMAEIVSNDTELSCFSQHLLVFLISTMEHYELEIALLFTYHALRLIDRKVWHCQNRDKCKLVVTVLFLGLKCADYCFVLSHNGRHLDNLALLSDEELLCKLDFFHLFHSLCVLLFG